MNGGDALVCVFLQQMQLEDQAAARHRPWQGRAHHRAWCRMSLGLAVTFLALACLMKWHLALAGRRRVGFAESRSFHTDTGSSWATTPTALLRLSNLGAKSCATREADVGCGSASVTSHGCCWCRGWRKMKPCVSRML